MAAPGILFRAVIKKLKWKKKLIKRELEYIKLLTKKIKNKKMKFYNFHLQVFKFWIVIW